MGSLTYKDLWQSSIAMVVLSLRIVFHRKLRFGVFGVLGYYAILYAIMTFNPSDGFSVEDALNILVQIPIAALAVYLASARSDGLTGKMLAAVWDPWENLDIEGVMATETYTVRRLKEEE